VRRVTRTSLDGTADNATTQSGLTALWVRATRTGANLTTEWSSDGVTWTALGTTVTLSSPTSTMLGRLAICSNNTTLPEIWGYARFDNVEVIGTPAAPANFIAGPAAEAGKNMLTWGDTPDGYVYRVERSNTSGSGYVEIATTNLTSYIDSGLTSGQTYYYRVRATNAQYTSPYSVEYSAAPLSETESWRLTNFGLVTNTGAAADMADPDGDGIVNLLEYALGRQPKKSDPSTYAAIGSVNVSSQDYLTVTFARKMSATGITLWVDAADSPAGPWTPIDPLDSANQVSAQTGVPAAGFQTLAIKDVVPVQGRPTRCMRLRVTRP